MMDASTKEILDQVIVDKREADLKSACMEPIAFKQSLNRILAAGVKVTEVVTVAHPTVKAMMSTSMLYNLYSNLHILGY
jgi:hypothetical protein